MQYSQYCAGSDGLGRRAATLWATRLAEAQPIERLLEEIRGQLERRALSG